MRRSLPRRCGLGSSAPVTTAGLSNGRRSTMPLWPTSSHATSRNERGSGSAGIPASTSDRRQAQVDLANRVLEVLAAYSTDLEGAEMVDSGAQLLLEVGAPLVPGRSRQSRPRPGIPLRDSVLLVNGHKDLQIGTQVALEIQSADRVDLLCAFVRFAGVRMIRKELEEFLLRGGEMRVIASVYTGSTEKRALDELVGLGAKVKVSYETAQTRLHAKAWLFDRNSGFHTAYVGSSNLTSWALLDGLEWNVRATAVDNPAIIDRIRATFEQYWNEPDFRVIRPAGRRRPSAGGAGCREPPWRDPGALSPEHSRGAEAVPGGDPRGARARSGSAGTSATSLLPRPAPARRGCRRSTTSGCARPGTSGCSS